MSLIRWLPLRACDFSPLLCRTQCLLSEDNALMRSCMKMYRKPPLMSICHPPNNTMCSPKASRNTTVLILPPLAVFEGSGRPVSFSVAYYLYKGPVDPRRLNPAALDAHPADVMICASLASSHQAVLRSLRLNELSSPVAGEGVRMMKQLLSFVQTIVSSVIKTKQNKSQSNLVLYPLKNKCIICAHPLELECYHNNVRLRHFHDCDSVKQRAESQAEAPPENSLWTLQHTGTDLWKCDERRDLVVPNNVCKDVCNYNVDFLPITMLLLLMLCANTTVFPNKICFILCNSCGSFHFWDDCCVDTSVRQRSEIFVACSEVSSGSLTYHTCSIVVNGKTQLTSFVIPLLMSATIGKTTRCCDGYLLHALALWGACAPPFGSSHFNPSLQ